MGGPSSLRIVDVQGFATSFPVDAKNSVTLGIGRAVKRDAVVVKVTTEAGIVGYGESHHGRCPGAVAVLVNTTLKQLVVGQDANDVVGIWNKIYVRQLGSHGMGAGACLAMSGIDQALWDIRGKVMNLPVYELLGGPVDPQGIRGYYHAEAWSLAQARELRDQTKAAGVTALKFQLPDLLEWVETGAKLTRAVKHMEMLREGLGPDLDFAVDFHARPSPTVAAIILREIEPLHLLFAEEICPPENVRAMARAVRYSATPIATGERLIAAYGCAELIDLGVIDILQPDIAHIGGVTALWKVSAAAEASGIRMAPHACEGPIGGIASLHVDAAGPNFLAQEICGFVDGGEKAKVWEDLMGFPAMRMVDGRYPLPTRPGLGIDISEAALKRYPFQGTRPFPTVFHEDGSVASI
jgi:galactonate dehydratase